MTAPIERKQIGRDFAMQEATPPAYPLVDLLAIAGTEEEM